MRYVNCLPVWRLSLFLWLSLVMLASGIRSGAGELVMVMVEQDGCHWCAQWDADIAAIYPRTPEGKIAPLRRVDLRAMPDDLSFANRVVFTPTFVLFEDGQEITRIEGYGGEEMFWWMIARVFRETGLADALPSQ